MVTKRLWLSALLLLLFCALCRAQEWPDSADSTARTRAVEYYYLQARSCMEQDSLDRCFELLQHCHALDPSSLTVMYDLSSFYAYLGKDSIAHAMLDHIVKEDPSNVYYNKALVNYYLKVGDVDAAIKVYENLLEKVESKSDIYMSLFSLYSERGCYEKAISMLEKLEKSEGANEDISLQKIRLYMEMRDSTRAVGTVMDMVRENPDDMRCRTLLGNTYFFFGDRDKAMEAYQSVLVVRPDDVYALGSLADIYANDANDSLYCDVVERMLKCEGLDTETRINALVNYIKYKQPVDSARVNALLQEMYSLPYDEFSIAEVYAQYLILTDSSPESVIPVLEKAHSLEPENLSVILKLLAYSVELDDMNAVYRYADNALLYMPDKLELYYYKGVASYMLGRKEESIDVYRQGLDMRSDDTSPGIVSTIYAFMGDTYHDLSMLDECMQAYDSALVYNDANLSVLNNYAYYLALAGNDLQRALDMSRRTIAAEPNNSTYIDTYAWVLFKLEHYSEALVYAEQLISSNVEASSDVYHHCGDIFAKNGDMERAVKYWVMARDAGDVSRILEKKIKKRKYYKDAKHRK